MTAPQSLHPTFLIIGAQKAGTTALFEYLAQHPSIVAPETKEINFFMCDAVFRKGLDFYHAYFPEETPETHGKLTFEASANYLRNEDAAARIFEYDPKMRLIVLLRDPILRAYSAWQMYRRFYRKNPRWYFDWMKSYNDSNCDAFAPRSTRFGDSFHEDIKEELQIVERGEMIEAPFLRHGYYEEQLKAYYRHFPEEQVNVECSQRFRGNTRAILADVEEFLGIPPNAWRAESLKPIFVGDYQLDLPSATMSLLKAVYEERNRQLFALLDREFDWL